MSNKIVEIDVQVRNADGLHMRPAMQFVDTACAYKCEVKVVCGQTQVDGKSIMQMTMLAATPGTSLRIIAKGDDAHDALEALRVLVEERMFDEPPMEGFVRS